SPIVELITELHARFLEVDLATAPHLAALAWAGPHEPENGNSDGNDPCDLDHLLQETAVLGDPAADDEEEERNAKPAPCRVQPPHMRAPFHGLDSRGPAPGARPCGQWRFAIGPLQDLENLVLKPRSFWTAVRVIHDRTIASLAIAATASIAASISSTVVVRPGLNRIVPFGPAPIVAHAPGAQCSPVRQAIPNAWSRSLPTSAGCQPGISNETTSAAPVCPGSNIVAPDSPIPAARRDRLSP